MRFDAFIENIFLARAEYCEVSAEGQDVSS